ncbi:hypothetical protein [Luedemannella helvata]|uniref:Integral membrane protein n=1 Tax=Luedemannella helvata TaxID=349315 RepID=A0ABN2JZ86_9ACTN
MRRLAVAFGVVFAVLLVASPASAFAHNRVHNVPLHMLLDVLTLTVVSAPVWTAYLWGGRRNRGLLVALIAVIQLPVGLVGFVPLVDPTLHAVALVAALLVTAGSLVYVRRTPAAPAPAAARVTDPG